MKHNMGMVEKSIRLALGVVLLGVGYYLGAFSTFWVGYTSASFSGFIIALAGVVIFITGLFAYCPINALLKVNTCEACRIGETHRHLPI